jgi:hypothetical protein
MSFHSGSGSVSAGLTRNYYLRRLTRNVPQAFDLETRIHTLCGISREISTVIMGT